MVHLVSGAVARPQGAGVTRRSTMLARGSLLAAGVCAPALLARSGRGSDLSPAVKVLNPADPRAEAQARTDGIFTSHADYVARYCGSAAAKAARTECLSSPSKQGGVPPAQPMFEGDHRVRFVSENTLALACDTLLHSARLYPPPPLRCAQCSPSPAQLRSMGQPTAGLRAYNPKPAISA